MNDKVRGQLRIDKTTKYQMVLKVHFDAVLDLLPVRERTVIASRKCGTGPSRNAREPTRSTRRWQSLETSISDDRNSKPARRKQRLCFDDQNLSGIGRGSGSNGARRRPRVCLDGARDGSHRSFDEQRGAHHGICNRTGGFARGSLACWSTEWNRPSSLLIRN